MKKQSILRLVIVAVIISAAFFVMAATSSTRGGSKEDCTAEKTCEQQAQSEFFLESLTRSLLSR